MGRPAIRAERTRPAPPRAVPQWVRGAAGALCGRGYQAGGTEMVRPSIRSTIRRSASKETPATRSSAKVVVLPETLSGPLQFCILEQRMPAFVIYHDSLHTKIEPTPLPEIGRAVQQE